MNKLKIGIVDYGIGNQNSIKNCLKSIGFKCSVTNEIRILDESQIILLPGVGAFEPAMAFLKRNNLDKFLIEKGRNNTPIIGICLGMQLLTTGSNENGNHKGLNLIPGYVDKLSTQNSFHIGWNSVKVLKKNKFWDIDGKYFYFNHSFALKELKDSSICSTKYDEIEFNSVIKKNKIIGIQFHPEKSQKEGKEFLLNLIKGLKDA